MQFVVTIPSDFTRRLVRGERAQVLIDADATDPLAAANPLAAAQPAIEQALRRDLIGPLADRNPKAGGVELVLQRRYNPEGKARLNIVPGLLAVILTMTMVMMTALAVTRERERGTMENLLAMPVRPLEVMIGKIAALHRHRLGAGRGDPADLAAAVRRRDRGQRRSCSASARRCSSPSTSRSASPSRR